ncbi:MAG: TIGR01777 family oxidoreductase [Bdellovibrionales bacterium]|nr:TIGR01777 family oxidoreductase [Bdellovibrionales bacterium]
MKTILLTGGTGLIGKELGLQLSRKGYRIIGISRNIKKAALQAPYPAQWIECDLEKTVPALNSYDFHGVIHLAGEGIADQSWSAAQKEKILKSRSEGTKNLVAALSSQKNLEFCIGASAIGIYKPTSGDEAAIESSPMDNGFLSKVTQEWEHAYSGFITSTRTILFRIGVVLSTNGGALPKMLFPAQIFASSKLGNGKQWMSWIHIDDLIRAFIFAAESKDVRGTYNLVAPQPSQQKEMAALIAKNIGAFNGPPVPGFMLKLLLGEQAGLVVTSLKVSSQKLIDAGFKFQYTNLASALADILKMWNNGHAVKTFKQFFPLPREKVFGFFKDAYNLQKITPPSLDFNVLHMSTPEIQEGTLITYKLKIHGVPVQWKTLIETWEANKRFVDTQIKGPYSLWHHTHTFEDLGNGTLMTDQIIYKLPLGLLGRTTAQAFVDSDVDKIFNFRRDSVGQYLN